MPVTQFAFKEKYRYQNGFNSYHESAILDNAHKIPD
jgi:homogentisate 1,2-dioxygenase